MKIIERARASGKYPPSLLRDLHSGDDSFEAAMVKILDTNGASVLRAPAITTLVLVWILQCLLTLSRSFFVDVSPRALPNHRSYSGREFQDDIAGRSRFQLMKDQL
jgi:hypothetical protein